MNTGLPPNGNPKKKDNKSLLWQSDDALTGLLHYKNNNKPNINCMNTLTNTSQKKMNLKVLSFAFIFFISFLSFGQTKAYSKKESCKSELNIVDGVNNKVTNSTGTSYLLALTNNGNESMVYTISIESPAFNRKNSNIKLKPHFFEYKTNTSKKFHSVKKSENLYQVSIAPKEVFTFIVELINPKEVKNGTKNTTEVTVTADKCKNSPIKTVLYTEVKKSTTRQF